MAKRLEKAMKRQAEQKGLTGNRKTVDQTGTMRTPVEKKPRRGKKA